MGALSWGWSAAQSYPSKSIRLIVPFPAGGATDILARAVSQKLSDRLGQTVVVDNKPGASGHIGADLVAKSQPNGHTLIVSGISVHATAQYLFRKLPFDPLKDFETITLFAKIPFILVVHPSLPVKSVQELIALARAKPGQINYASAGIGSTSHFAGELMKKLAKVDMLHIPYKGSAPSMTALASGEVEA